jgi:hypothetical protein
MSISAYKVFNLLSIIFGLLAIILCIMPFLFSFSQGYVLAILFSMPGMFCGLVGIYMNMKYAYEPTIKSFGFWGMLMSSMPVLVYMIVLVIYNIRH